MLLLIYFDCNYLLKVFVQLSILNTMCNYIIMFKTSVAYKIKSFCNIYVLFKIL